MTTLSIVLCTRNRAQHLHQTLSSYEGIKADVSWELIIVDNGSSDGTGDILREYAASTSVRIRTVVEPRPGLSRARNTGWRLAQGEIVAFTDDDCYPQADYVVQLSRVFADPSVGFCGGRILLHDADDYPITILLKEDRVPLPARTITEAGFIQGANMAARRHVLETVGGFDERLGAGTPFPSEDIDFITRASFAGFDGLYDPGPAVAHHHRRRSKDQVRALQRSYDIGRGAYYMKCMLESQRRGALLRKWYWDALNRKFKPRREERPLLRRTYELYGGVGFLSQHITSKLRGGLRSGTPS